MKKLIPIMIILIISVISGTYYLKDINENKKEYKQKLIRFHVIANSDKKEDQELKLKVRDKVIAFLSPKLEKSKSIEESKKIIEKNITAIQTVAMKEIESNKSTYPVNVSLGYSNFPTKKYSNIVLPAGNYRALKVVIGKGEGKNWWCVMFPPLCFVDINHGITDKKTEKSLKRVLTQGEYNMIVADNSENVKLKFKIVEILEKMKNKNKNFALNKK